MNSPFQPRYEFKVTAGPMHETQTYICAKGMAHDDGEGTLTFWIEHRHPDQWDWETGTQTPAHTETIRGESVYSYALIKGKGENEYATATAPYLLRSIVIALARNDVGGRSASDLLYAVLWQVAVKPRKKWLREGAPEWFALVDPRARQNA